MKVAVTGANGFVGRPLVEQLCGEGFFVRAAARAPVSGLPENAEWIKAPDLGSDGDWAAAVDGMDSLVHCAARVHMMADDAADPLREFRRINRDGTMALARAAAVAGVKRFVFLSSIKVNGEATAGRPFRSDDLPEPMDPYGISKLEAEDALFALSRETGMEVVVIRPVLVYGPGVRANFRAMMKAVATGVPLPLGAIDNRRSMVFVDNLTDLIQRGMTHPAAAGEVFLVSDGHDLSTTEMLRKLADAMHRPARLVPIPPILIALAARCAGKKSIAQRLIGSLAVDIGPTCETLEWSPPLSIEQGFAKTVNAYQKENSVQR